MSIYGKGVSPRKAMAMGDGGNFGVQPFPSSTSAVTHVDPSEGRAKELGDHERGAGLNAPGYGKNHGRQAAPHHGPVPDHFSRGGRA